MEQKPVKNSLYFLSKENLKVSLLKLRSTTSESNRSSSPSGLRSTTLTFSFPELVERIKTCKGIEVIHLISALPHSGLRPDLLELLESFHPVIMLLYHANLIL